MSDTVTYTPYAFVLHDDPYDTYRRLRDEAPAYWNEELRFWVLSRFEDVQNAFRDHETFSSAGGVALEARRPVGVDPTFQQMIEIDPPDHTAFRSIVSRVFTGRRVLTMEDEIRRIVDGYIDEVIEAGSCDLVNDISGPFPMDVISAVLGIPEHDRDALRVSADKILIREDGSMQIPEEAMNGMFELLGYFVQDLESRRAGDRTGLITDLLDAEVDGRKLNEQELLGFCVLFVIAGHETTTKMVANAVELLSRHPDQQALLAGEPERVATAVEEVLRFHNSTQYMHRTLTTDIERHGQTMRAGDSVLLLIGARTTTSASSASPPKSSTSRAPRPAPGFGYGAHFCLGAALARLEGRVALEQIHARLPDYVVDHEHKVRFHPPTSRVGRASPSVSPPGLVSERHRELAGDPPDDRWWARRRRGRGDLPQHRSVDRPGDRCRSRCLTGRRRTSARRRPLCVRRERLGR